MENSSNKMSFFQQPSLPTTPNTHTLNQNQSMFQYPPLASENLTPSQGTFDFNSKRQQQKTNPLPNDTQFTSSRNPIQNLIPQFMMNETANNELLNSSFSSDYSGLFNKKKTSVY